MVGWGTPMPDPSFGAVFGIAAVCLIALLGQRLSRREPVPWWLLIGGIIASVAVGVGAAGALGL